MPDETAGALTVDEASELDSLERDMADTRGRNHVDWHDAYHNSPRKQARALELYRKLEGGPDPDASPWPVAKPQPVEDRGEAVKEPVQAQAEVLATWSESLGTTPEMTQSMFDRIGQLVDDIGQENMQDFDLAFEGLSDQTQWWAYRALAAPERLSEFLATMPDECLDQLNYFLVNIEDNYPTEERAIRRAIGLAV